MRGKKDDITSLTPMAYNYTAAFAEYSRGTKLEDISLALAIPIDALKNKTRTEGWAKLSADMQVNVAVVPRAERDLAKIEANRARWAELTDRLFVDISNVVDRLLSGELTFKKVTPSGQVVELEPSLKDRKTLAEYAAAVAGIAYRAHGDTEKGSGSDAPGANQGGPTLIQINLPGPVAAPRQDRALEAQIVDVERLPRIAKGFGKDVTAEPVASEATAKAQETPANIGETAQSD